MEEQLISMGYLYKRVSKNDDCCPGATNVKDIYSLSGCISEDFADFIGLCKNNNYWLFNNVEEMNDLACELGVPLDGVTTFFYKVYPLQWRDDKKVWEPFESEFGFHTEVKEPEMSNLEGFDVVSYSGQSSPECSPLSCNAISEVVQTNEHCLFSTLAEAKEAIERGVFEGAEPSPWRIVAVYSV